MICAEIPVVLPLLNETQSFKPVETTSFIEINNPGFWICLFFLIIIFFYCCYLIYFSFTVKTKKQKFDYFPIVSVLVDAKNASNTIRRRIENLLKQNYPKNKYEIIVYDRNSKDNTEVICREYEKQGKIKYIRGDERYEIKGPLLDLAIEKLAKGEILLLTDPDVISEKNWILEMVQPFKDPKVGVVAGTVHCGNYYKGFFPLMRAVEDEWRFVAPMLRNSDTVFPVGANQALRREAWEQTKFGNKILDDLDITTRIIDKGWKSVGVSATGVEEEVETLQQYWKQRTRWYRVNVGEYFGKTKFWKKFIEALPHSIQLIMAALMIIFVFSLFSKTLWALVLLDFILLNVAMVIAFIRTKTGVNFIPYISLYLIIDTLFFVVTVFYVQIVGRFVNVTKEAWPSLQVGTYHSGSELKTWFFKFGRKVKDYTKM
ncbi:MAG: glycosyltransferase family 2 protein [Candidatus Pacearchaeota archaeon]|nr:glycosyltransferase family 2 protein [Candidatus Pacearchaeota archaeon]